jgi:hypothetical protein
MHINPATMQKKLYQESAVQSAGMFGGKKAQAVIATVK